MLKILAIFVSYKTIKQRVMKRVELTAKQIEEQKQYANKFYNLIKKELGYGDLCNLENIASYSKSFKHHSELAKSGVVYLEIGF